MHHTTLRSHRPLAARPFEQCETLLEFIARVFQGTGWRFGELHFAEPMEDTPNADLIACFPEEFRTGWTWFEEVDVLVDPRRGALLLRSSGRYFGEDFVDLTDNIAGEWAELCALEAKIRARLEASPFWQGRTIPIASAVVVGHEDPADIVLSPRVPPEAVITREQLAGLKAAAACVLDRLLPADAWRSPAVIARLVQDLTANPEVGHFVDEATLLATCRYRDLEEGYARAM